MAKSRSENVAINTGASIAMRLISQVLGFFLKIVFIRALGDAYQGVSSLFGDILSMLSMAELGISTAIAYALYKPLKECDDERIAALMGFYKKAYRYVAAFIMVVGLICVPFLPYLIKGQVPNITESLELIFILFIIDSSSSYLLVYKTTILSASQKRYIISKISIIFSFIRTGVQCILLLVFKNYILYLLFGIFETLLRNYVISRASDKEFPLVKNYPNAKLEGGEIKRLMKDVFALSLYKINGVIVSSSDSMVIATMFDKGVLEVGYLSLYRMLINTVDVFVNQFYISALPSLGNLAQGSTPERQHEVFKTFQFITFWCLCFTTTSLLTLSTPFISLFRLGKGFSQPLLILAALLVDNYVKSMLRPINNFRNSNGLFVQGKYRPIFMSIIDISLSIALARPFGIAGVLIATTISRIFTSVWYDPWLVYSSVFQSSVSSYWQHYAKYLVITIVSSTATYLLANAIVPANVYVAFIIKLLLCAVIPNLIVILCFRRSDEYAQFMARLMPMVGKITRFIKRK